jgi:hypothetical protein
VGRKIEKKEKKEENGLGRNELKGDEILKEIQTDYKQCLNARAIPSLAQNDNYL